LPCRIILNRTGFPLALYDDPDNAFVAGFIGSPRHEFPAGFVVSSRRKHHRPSGYDDHEDGIEVPHSHLATTILNRNATGSSDRPDIR